MTPHRLITLALGDKGAVGAKFVRAPMTFTEDFLKRLVTSYLLALTVAMVLRTLLHGQYRLALDSQTDVIIRCVRKDAHVVGKDA
jgi:hypothetical protein